MDLTGDFIGNEDSCKMGYIARMVYAWVSRPLAILGCKWWYSLETFDPHWKVEFLTRGQGPFFSFLLWSGAILSLFINRNRTTLVGWVLLLAFFLVPVKYIGYPRYACFVYFVVILLWFNILCAIPLKMKKLLILIAAILGISTVSAQKFARVNMQEIVVAMPEFAEAQKNLEAFGKDLQEQMEQIQVEFNNKLADFQKNQATMAASIKQMKQQEEKAAAAQRHEDKVAALTDIIDDVIDFIEEFYPEMIPEGMDFEFDAEDVESVIKALDDSMPKFVELNAALSNLEALTKKPEADRVVAKINKKPATLTATVNGDAISNFLKANGLM